jgi:hypothetical protein
MLNQLFEILFFHLKFIRMSSQPFNPLKQSIVFWHALLDVLEF